MKTVIVTCKNENCDRTFRVPEFKYNSTIKNNPDKQECKICSNVKLLAKSTLYSPNKVKKTNIGFKSHQSTSKSKSGVERSKSTKSKAMANADLWFSRYIRIKYAYKIQDGDVFCQCIVNRSVIKHAKSFDNGHFYSRAYQATRYNENNCRPQNRSSNRFKGEADHPIFADHLTEEIGTSKFMGISAIYRQTVMVSTEYFKEQADKYRKLTNNLVTELKINKWW